jgi:hypothetical protein
MPCDAPSKTLLWHWPCVEGMRHLLQERAGLQWCDRNGCPRNMHQHFGCELLPRRDLGERT